MKIHEVLEKYWGFESFRPLQEDIINSVLEGKDTLALLPTGGGKSLCYQVPGIALEGVCIVVSPLIALMKDQVNGLKKRGIRASALVSGMRESEVDAILDNCIYGGTKFLYLSPERLKSEMVQERIALMKVNLFAVDEAHCISQWGYDFRPSYLEVENLREIKPEVPVLALTATATPEVAKDIQQKLQFKEDNILQKSFARENLAYMAFHEEDKMHKLDLMLKKNEGSVIIYMRSRSKTEQIASWLNEKKFSASYYHAGLKAEERQKRQHAWTEGKTRIMVSTNAFGMGIDKADVRLVIHLDIPESPEAYFQEAGRGGRDGKKSFAVMLFDNYDIQLLKDRFRSQFPPIKNVKRAYKALSNHLQLAAGSAEGEEFEFDVGRLASSFNIDPYEIRQSFKILELAGLLQFEENSFLASRLRMICSKADLYHYELNHERESVLTRTILRSHIGIFDKYAKINEQTLAKRSGETVDFVRKTLENLDKLDIVSYIPHSSKPRVLYLKARQKDSDLEIPKEAYRQRKKTMKKKLLAMLDFVQSKEICRARFLLDYFGEKKTKDCGICDVCLAKRISPKEIESKVLGLLDRAQHIDEIRLNIDCSDEHLLRSLRHMIDRGLIKRKEDIFERVKFEQ